MMNPEYRRIYHALRKSIEAGEYPVGSRLPTEPQLEKLFGVSRTTIRHAIALLASESIVQTKQGSGTVVKHTHPHTEAEKVRFHGVPAITERIYGKNREENAHMLLKQSHVETAPVYGEIAEALELAPGQAAYRVHRVHSFKDVEPFSYKVNYLRMDMFPGLEKYDGKVRNLYGILEAEYGKTFVEGDETVTAVAADFLDAQVLNVPVGSPLVQLTRCARCENGPLEWAVTKFRPEYYELRVHMDGPPPKLHKPQNEEQP